MANDTGWDNSHLDSVTLLRTLVQEQSQKGSTGHVMFSIALSVDLLRRHDKLKGKAKWFKKRVDWLNTQSDKLNALVNERDHTIAHQKYELERAADVEENRDALRHNLTDSEQEFVALKDQFQALKLDYASAGRHIGELREQAERDSNALTVAGCNLFAKDVDTVRLAEVQECNRLQAESIDVLSDENTGLKQELIFVKTQYDKLIDRLVDG